MQYSWLHLLVLVLLLVVAGQCVQAVTVTSSRGRTQRPALLVWLRCIGCCNTTKVMLTVPKQQQRQKQQCKSIAVAALAGS
jgi:uncharacterized integral membrane protein